MRRLLAIALLLAPAQPGAAQEEFTTVDRILAVVDEDPILESEVEQVIGLGLLERRRDEEGEEEFRRRVLDRLIEQRLRFHEIDRFGFAELPIDEVERQFAAFRESFASEAEFSRRLEELELDETALRQLVARQMMVVTYVEERLDREIDRWTDELRRKAEIEDYSASGRDAPPS